MRVAQPIVLNEETRRKLEQQSRGVPRRRVWCCAAASFCWLPKGYRTNRLPQPSNVAPRMAALWRGRFVEHGIEGLMKGRTSAGPHSDNIESVVDRQDHTERSSNATQWSTRTMARGDGHLQGFGVTHLARQRL